jgi:long-chain fatty acid transport protein
MHTSRRRFLPYLFAAGWLFAAPLAHAQTFGVELHNTVMPAAGGMGGVSIAQPQDLTSAVNGNPAALTQFRGTQFLFGGAWVEPTFNLTQTQNIPPVGPLIIGTFTDAKSTAPGTPAGNIGITQDLSQLGLPATLGLGFVTTSGGFADFRHVPASNNTNSASTIFNLPAALGIDVTDRMSIGAGVSLGIAFFDGPFANHSGMTPDYALRGTLGVNYLLTDATTIGGYYQTEQSYRFDNAVTINILPNRDVRMDLPQNLGLGIANTSLMDGCLLLGADVLYKVWDEANLYQAVYDNQWVVQLGAQYSRGRLRLRGGYAWAENPIDQTPLDNIGGVIQLGGLPAVRYTQALLAITSQHRISAGVGIVDVLPGLDMDLMAGGMLRDTEGLGEFTTTTISSYWIGVGITWRFGRGSYCPTGIPDSWSAGA